MSIWWRQVWEHRDGQGGLCLLFHFDQGFISSTPGGGTLGELPNFAVPQSPITWGYDGPVPSRGHGEFIGKHR